MLVKRCFFSSLVLAVLAFSAISVVGTPPDTRSIQNGAPITVTAPDVETSTGMNISVSITATDTTGLGATGFDARIQFDPAVVTFQGCSLTGTIFPSAAVNCNIFPSSEFISINVFNGGSTPPASGAGAILKLNFLVIGTQGQSSPLNFVSFNFNEGDPASVTNNGSISLLPVTAAGVTVSGRLLTNLGRPVSRGTVSLTDASGNIRRAQTNTLGYFRFTDVSAGETYLIAATAKGYTFSSSLLSVMDQIADIEILAEP